MAMTYNGIHGRGGRGPRSIDASDLNDEQFEEFLRQLEQGWTLLAGRAALGPLRRLIERSKDWRTLRLS